MFKLEYLSTEHSTLYLNSWTIELEQKFHDLEALNQVMKDENWQKKSEVELLA